MNVAWLPQVGDHIPHINVRNLHPYHEVSNGQSLKQKALLRDLTIVLRAHYVHVCVCVCELGIFQI